MRCEASEVRLSKPMRVCLDVSSLYRRYRTHSGIPRFVRALLKALETRKDINIVQFVNCSELADRLDRASLQDSVRRGDLAAVYRTGRCDGIDLQLYRPDVIHSTFYHPPDWLLDLGAPWVATVHDLRPLDDPGSVEDRHIKLFSRIGPTIEQRAVYVHCVSRFSASRIRLFWKFPSDHIRVIYPAVEGPQEGIEHAHYRSKLPRPYVLFLSTVQPAKDVSTAIEAFSLVTNRLKLKRIHLVVAGNDVDNEPNSAVWDRLLVDGIAARLKRVSDKERLALLSMAKAVLCTSRYEGFGFVPIEAISLGSPPIISSSYPSLEVIPRWPYKFTSGNIEDCARILSDVLTQQELTNSEINAAARQVAKLNYRRMASEFYKLYHDAIDRHAQDAEQLAERRTSFTN